MELTQKLDFETAEDTIYATQKTEQIGFLGICGTIYPVNIGPNKVGRDADKCEIFINSDTLSRQHAVINVLNRSEFMLMDLNSSNKTKLGTKTLQPYIPLPLKNGDTVQFGKILGIFRLLEEDNDLPMTQVVDIPETPICTRHISRSGPKHIVPESPDVSDKDESYIPSSQYNEEKFINKFVKISGKTVMQPKIGTNELNNSAYWNSSIRSPSIKLDNSTINESSLDINKSNVNNEDNVNNIYEMETQAFTNHTPNNGFNSIHTVNTQLPEASTPSIYNMETQIPNEYQNTLPTVQTVNTQQNMDFEISTSNNLVEVGIIFEAVTQITSYDLEPNKKPITNADDENKTSDFIHQNKDNATMSQYMNESDELIIFDEIESQGMCDDTLSSQPLLIDTPSVPSTSAADVNLLNENCDKGNDSDVTDCEELDILPTQILPHVPDNDVTDCEDDLENDTQIIPENKEVQDTKFMPVEIEDMPTQIIDGNSDKENDHNIEELDTQIINNETTCDNVNKINFLDEISTQILPYNEIVNNFKVPFSSPMKKKKEKYRSPSKHSHSVAREDSENGYYNNTQEVFNDLLTQEEPITTRKLKSDNSRRHCINNFDNIDHPIMDDDEIVPSSAEVYHIGERFPHLPGGNDNGDKVIKYVSNLSAQQVREIIGAQTVTVTRSSSSDSEITPKKMYSKVNLDMELPDSQEIKKGVCLKRITTETSSESETEENSEENSTPILHRKKMKTSNNSKVNLTNKFYTANLPSRFSVRVKKPTSKLEYADDATKLQNKRILKSKLLTDKDVDINNEIITENISRLKGKNVDKTPNSDKTDDLKSTIAKEPIGRLVGSLSKSDYRGLIKDSRESKFKLDDSSSKSDYQDSIKERRRPKFKLEDTSSKTAYQVSIKERRRPKTKLEDSSSKSDYQDSIKERRKPQPILEDSSSISDYQVSTKKRRIPKSKLKDSSSKSDYKASIKERRKPHSKLEDSPPKSDYQVSVKERRRPKTELEDSSSKSDYQESINERCKDNKKNNRGKKHTIKLIKKETTYNMKTVKVETANARILTIERQENCASSSGISSISTRSTRNRENGMRDDKKANDKNNKTEDSKKAVNKRRNLSAEGSDNLRRSTRNKSDNILGTNKQRSKSNEKGKSKNHEQSAVYSLSSDYDKRTSPLLRKRLADDDIGGHGPKRAKVRTSEDKSNISDSVKPTSANVLSTQRVLCTALPNCEKITSKLTELGAVIVTDVKSCTVLVTPQVKRTLKLLCAVGLGRPIVGVNWIQACVENGCIVDPWDYLIEDRKAETRFNFNMAAVLTGRRGFLEGYNVSSTPHVTPTPQEMRLIIECSGGTWQEGGRDWVCLSCREDKSYWSTLKRRGAVVVSTEFILSGVLQQSANVKKNLLY